MDCLSFEHHRQPQENGWSEVCSPVELKIDFIPKKAGRYQSAECDNNKVGMHQ